MQDKQHKMMERKRALSRWALYPTFFACVVCLLSSSVAQAHGTLPRGITPFLDSDRQLVGGFTSYGLIKFGEGTTWTAEETLPRLIQWAHYSGDDHIIVGTPVGVFETDDWGCSWQRQEGPLARLEIAHVHIDPTTPGRLFAASRERGQLNDLFESLDGGRTWANTGFEDYDGRVERVVVSGNGQEVWALTFNMEGLYTLHRSSDGGVSWDAPPIELEGREGVNLLGLSEDANAVFVSDASSSVEQRLHRLVIGTGELEELGRFPGLQITSAAEFKGQVLVVVASLESAQLFGMEPGGAFEESLGGPNCLDPFIEPGVLWGCGSFGNGVNFLSSDDGRNFTNHIRFVEVCPAFCPAETNGAELIPELWPSVNAEGVGALTCEVPEFQPDAGVMDTSTNDTDEADVGTLDVAPNDAGIPTANDGGGSCGCTSMPARVPGGAAGVLFGLVCFWGVRRSKREVV